MLDYFRYFDEVVAALVCYGCAHRICFMQWTKTPCVDVVAIGLLGFGAMFHGMAAFYGWRVDSLFGDPATWTGIALWGFVPSVRKWAQAHQHRRLLSFLSKRVLNGPRVSDSPTRVA